MSIVEKIDNSIPGVIDEQYSHVKVILSGDIIEVYEMDKKPIAPFERIAEKAYSLREEYEHYKADYLYFSKKGWRNKAEFALQQMNFLEFELEELISSKPREDRKEERRWQVVRDARNRCRRLATKNFSKANCTFMTLTVAENEDDVLKYDDEFKKFFKRLRRKYGDCKYLAVREFQDRGAIHYHVLIDIPFLSGISQDKYKREAKEREVARVWRHGFVDLVPIEHVDNLGAYLVKYMTKEMDDIRLKGRKMYLCSKGLNKPLELKGLEAITILKALEMDNKKTAFENSYFSEYCGDIKYKEFNLSRD